MVADQLLVMLFVLSLSLLNSWGARLSSHLKLTTAPTLEPISPVDLKVFLRIDHNEEDLFLENLIKTARQMAEDFTGRAFINQSWTLWLDRLPRSKSRKWWDGVQEGHYRTILGGGDEIILPRSPLVSVTHFKSYDDSDTASTFAASSYIVDTSAQPGRIILKNGAVWPTNLRPGRAIEIEFVCGYGAAASSVPAPIKHALYLICGQLYEKRGDVESPEIPKSAKSILANYRVYQFGTLNPEGGL